MKKQDNLRLVQLKLTHKAFDELSRLKEDTNAMSLTEVIRNSLAFYRWAIDQKINGGSILSKPKDNYEEIIEVVFPF